MFLLCKGYSLLKYTYKYNENIQNTNSDLDITYLIVIFIFYLTIEPELEPEVGAQGKSILSILTTTPFLSLICLSIL